MFAMAENRIPRNRLLCASGLLLIAAGCAQPTATVSVVAPPVPSGQARVWFYRPWEPSESFNFALIDMNGSYVGAVDPREVVSDPEARYFGGRVEKRSLVPLGEARLGRIGLDEWLRRSKA